MSRKRRPVKWGHTSSINYRFVPGSEAWFAAHPSHKIRKLSAWRLFHKVAKGHGPVRSKARSLGKNPSSRLTTRQILSLIRDLRGY